MQPSSRKPAESRPQRIGSLAVLPVFLDLRDRAVIVAGGSAAAAWKAELLAAAGAVVTAYAAEPGAEMLALGDSILLRRRPWQPSDIDGAALAVIDAESEAAAAAFRAAARKAGAICNIIDQPALCDVQFGAIVNRSPVVVGISTAGAAPVLAQAIRRRIETALPATLGQWAAAAKRIRHMAASIFPLAPQRRAFWARLAERAFTESKIPSDRRLLSDATQTPGGQVTLVGAGPGDAELLTLKAMRALQAADVILFDDLVSNDVLELARREAKRMLVGKRGGRPSCKQQDINALMIKLARQGRRVVRLKSGDPMVFGRAGEEIAALEAAGIPVEIVPGITAAVAAAGRLGVSLTHRDAAQSVSFITAHSRLGGLPQDIDWDRFSDPRATLILYMAGRTGAEAAATLMKAGLPPSTPAVVMASISRADEAIWHGQLEAIGEGLARIGCDRPVLIGIGAVFAEAKKRPSSRPEIFLQPSKAPRRMAG